MVAAFFHRSKAQGVGVFKADLQAKSIDVKRPGAVQICHAVVHMTEPHDIEGGVKLWIGQWHQVSLSHWSEGSGGLSAPPRAPVGARIPPRGISEEKKQASRTEPWDVVRPRGNADMLLFHVKIEGPVATITADAAGLDPAKRGRKVTDVL